MGSLYVCFAILAAAANICYMTTQLVQRAEWLYRMRIIQMLKVRQHYENQNQLAEERAQKLKQINPPLAAL